MPQTVSDITALQSQLFKEIFDIIFKGFWDDFTTSGWPKKYLRLAFLLNPHLSAHFFFVQIYGKMVLVYQSVISNYLLKQKIESGVMVPATKLSLAKLWFLYSKRLLSILYAFSGEVRPLFTKIIGLEKLQMKLKIMLRPCSFRDMAF